MEIPEKNKVPVDLIARYLNGDADTDDIIDLEQWKNSSGENLRAFEECRRIWEKTGQLSLFADIDIENEWNVSLTNNNNEEDERADAGFTWKQFLRVAVIVLIGLIMSYGVWYSYHSLQFERIVAKKKVVEVNMPDGSLVSLNRKSKIIYSYNFINNREVTLDGEAFFKVAEDPKNPFIIKSGEVRIEVIGTSFNVIAYKNENIVQVFVESGKVAVYNKYSDYLEKSFLEEGDRIIYSRETGMGSVQLNSDLNYNSWKTGNFRFENSTLQYVINLLEKNYNTSIDLINPALNQCRVSVSFNNESLEDMLETITEILDLELIRSEKGFFIDGQEC